MSAVRRYWRLLRPYGRGYALGLLLLFFTNGLSLAVPWLTKGAIDALAAQRAGLAAPVEHLGGLLSGPLSYALALAVTGTVLAAIRTGSRIAILGLGRDLMRDLLARLYDHLLRADPAFYARFGTGEIMSRCVSDTRIMQAVAAPGVLYTFNAVFMFGLAVPYLFSVSWKLTALLLLPYPLLAAGTMWTVTRVRTYAHEAQQAMDALTTQIQETLAGMEVVKAFTLEELQATRFGAGNDTYLEKSMREAVARGGIGIASALVGGIGTALLLWIGGQAVARGELSYGDLALFLGVLALILRPTVYLGWVLSLAQRGLASLDRLDELLDAPVKIVTPTDAHPGPLRGEVELRGLSFRYPTAREGEERRLALDDVSLRVAPGGVLGLVGRIGSGKSTVLRAVPRFLDAPAGSVLVDGVPLERWDLGALRGGIGYVPQDGAVFSLSLGANVAFGKPDASPDEIAEAARVACLDRDLDQLADGLETLVGERGVTLSGGQRQRLAIARAVLIRPRVLLLDDALSMVDAETAVAILKNLRAALGDTTVLVAAHRTATLLGTDEVLVLAQGRVVERGAPQALLEQADSQFHAMHERQRLREALEAE